MSLTLLHLLVARFWKFFLSTYILIGLIWIFSICVRVFIRQEAYSINLLFLLTLKSLPSILPYITCLAAMLTIINLGKTRELQLTTLMGVSRQKRFLHFFPLWIILPLLCFYFEGFIKPHIRQTLKNPENFLTQGLINKLDHGFELSSGGWVLGSDSKGSILIAQDHPEKSTILLSQKLTIDKDKNLIAKDGYLWGQANQPDEVIQFKESIIPLARDSEPSAKEKMFFDLDLTQLDQRHQAGIIIRNTLSPFFLLYLGLALGYYGIKIKRGTSFLLCLGSLLLLYLPLHILGRSIKTELFISHIGILSLPFIACILLGLFLNLKAEKHGAC